MTRFVKFAFLLLGAAALSSAEGTVSWQQVGGSLQVDPGFKGIVGQSYTTSVQGGEGTTVQGGFLAHPYFVNLAPFVAAALPDLDLAAGLDPVLVHLDSVFADFSGNPLTYSVTTDGQALLATVSGDTLRLASQGNGTVQVIVTATDGKTAVSDTFSVALAGPTGIASRPAALARSRELSARISHVFATEVSGSGAGRLSTDLSGCTEESCLSLELALPSASSVRVSIYDQIGTPVIRWERDYSQEELKRIGAGPDGRYPVTLNWNLRASNGAAVAPGVYLWKFEALTVGGQKLETVKRMGVKGAKR